MKISIRNNSNGSGRIEFGSATIERDQFREVGGAFPQDRKKASGIAQPTFGANLPGRISAA
jgi:hypothetical protein